MCKTTLSISDWKQQAKEKFKTDDVKQWKFKCPNCQETQTAQDFITAGVESPENKFYYSCIGRWVSNRGCNWTLGGLFQIHQTEIITETGDKVPVFEFAD